jgi:dihydrofolate reductase
MRKVIAAINMTLDGVFDHTAGVPDEEIHEHYADFINSADVILYGRITYELMKFWQSLVKNPSGEKTMDDFAIAIDKIPKLIFSRQLKNTGWDSAKLTNQPIEEVVKQLKQESGKDILVGSRSLIMQLLKLNLIDEFQLCIYPVVAGSGSALFENINDRTFFKLNKTKIFKGGAIMLYYEPIN